jgi:ribokinase
LNAAPAADLPRAVLERSDLIVVNETEATFYGAALRGLRGLVAITRGARTAQLWRAGLLVAEATPPAIHVVDSTGAGDAFVAALTVAMLERQAEADALRFACAAGAAATMRAGAQPSLPTRQMVESLLAGGIA